MTATTLLYPNEGVHVAGAEESPYWRAISGFLWPRAVVAERLTRVCLGGDARSSNRYARLCGTRFCRVQSFRQKSRRQYCVTAGVGYSEQYICIRPPHLHFFPTVNGTHYSGTAAIRRCVGGQNYSDDRFMQTINIA